MYKIKCLFLLSRDKVIRVKCNHRDTEVDLAV